MMKVVIFAHTPPPWHGQSYMVKLLLEGLQSKHRQSADSPTTKVPRVRCYHVDARLSESLDAVGSVSVTKLLRLLRYCGQAIWYRFRYGARILYYVPAPGKRGALYRDWVVMALCRPFFARVVFHWHAVGLGAWTRDHASMIERALTMLLLGRSDLNLVLSEFARADAAILRPRRIAVVPNGMPDPCPQFETQVKADRRRRFVIRFSGTAEAASEERPSFTILFLAACTAEKGLFATVEAFAVLKKQEASTPIQLRLKIAGAFMSEVEQREFERRIALSDLNGTGDGSGSVEYVGFADATSKAALLETSDCLCFPSVYQHEAQPVVLIEALAYDLPVVATRWRGIPDLLTDTVSFLVQDQSPQDIAQALGMALRENPAGANRRQFLQRFHVRRFNEEIAAALETLA